MLTTGQEGLYTTDEALDKAWRELKEVVYSLDENVLKPRNLGGTRWFPHLQKALTTLLKNFHPVYLHFKNTMAARTRSVDMEGRTRYVLREMASFRSMLLIHLVMEILECLSW